MVLFWGLVTFWIVSVCCFCFLLSSTLLTLSYSCYFYCCYLSLYSYYCFFLFSSYRNLLAYSILCFSYCYCLNFYSSRSFSWALSTSRRFSYSILAIFSCSSLYFIFLIASSSFFLASEGLVKTIPWGSIGIPIPMRWPPAAAALIA